MVRPAWWGTLTAALLLPKPGMTPPGERVGGQTEPSGGLFLGIGHLTCALCAGAMAGAKEVAVSCEMVVLVVAWDNVPDTLASFPRWKNQILIDGTNPFHGKAGKFTPADVGNLSTSQLVAALAPGARVVKAFNHMIVPNLEEGPIVNGARRVAFVSADDNDAKKRVETLLKTFGYSVIDLGDLRDGGLIQQAGGPLAGRDLLERGEYK